jgi:hypothetical protein
MGENPKAGWEQMSEGSAYIALRRISAYTKL